MEAFVQEYTNADIRNLLTSKLAFQRKMVNKLLMLPRRQLDGFSTIERLGYIVKTQDYDAMRDLKYVFNEILRGSANFNCRQFDEFLLKHSTCDDFCDSDDESSEEFYL